ncbi:MAG: hypothetical protein H6719_13845 [Sandaracinaceae bacterium]|nr:hypothetical protein [Sandaracinaceae bacterium]
MRASALALTLCLASSTASAQAVDLTRPEPAMSALTDVRLSLEVERREAGVVLVFEGLLSLVAGGLVAGFGNADPFWLSFGVGTAGWGAVNAALAIAMLDLDDQRQRAVEAERGLRYDDVDRARAAAIRQQEGAATLFAFNAGLDVFYLATGVLLFVLADQLTGPDEPDLLRGYAVAQLGQGGFLLVFDLVEWIASNGRAARLR